MMTNVPCRKNLITPINFINFLLQGKNNNYTIMMNSDLCLGIK